MSMKQVLRSGLALLATMSLGLACSPSDLSDEETAPRDSFGTLGPTYEPSYAADLAAVNALWGSGDPITTIEDAYKVKVVLRSRELPPSSTHLFGEPGDPRKLLPVKVLPYHDNDNVTDAAGNSIERGDQEIAKAFPPGQIGYAIKHHRPQYRVLSIDENSEAEGMKEHFKLQDTHIELVIGVEKRDGKPGVVTLNNPQTYPDPSNPGRFGDPNYSMIFVKPDYPSYLTPAQRQAFNDNIRSMMVAFNEVSNFPPGYNGSDPLAAYDTEHVIEHARRLVLAIAGNEAERTEAREWFKDPQNLIYCAELGHVSTSAGLHLPLNAKTFEPLVGKVVWDNFVKLAERHNRGEVTPFTETNGNGMARLVKITIADENLEPAWSYAPADQQATERARLAFHPMTLADIVEEFTRTHIPREQLGEELADEQADLLEIMRPGLLKIMGIDKLPDTDDKRKMVENLFSEIIAVVRKQYNVGTAEENYKAFREALKLPLAKAAMITGPRPGSFPGNAYFTPPSMFHVIAQGKHGGGLLGLRYVGHGLHFSVVRPK